MPRFFIPKTQVTENAVTILGDDARHIARALRMAVGDELTVCDDAGRQYECRLSRIRDEEVTAEILSTADGVGEPPYFLTLYMAYPKGDKLETVIQKAVELGASRIVPFESSRCIKRPKADKAEKVSQRLSRIAAEAAKQCGRARVPEVSEPLSFKKMLEEGAAAALPLFCYEADGTKPLSAYLSPLSSPPATISVVVGCEGGFSPEEATAARDAGFALTGLGSRILRCETAPAFVLSAISYRFEL